jgi:hypothetical protein
MISSRTDFSAAFLGAQRVECHQIKIMTASTRLVGVSTSTCNFMDTPANSETSPIFSP